MKAWDKGVVREEPRSLAERVNGWCAQHDGVLLASAIAVFVGLMATCLAVRS